ncbi:MAG: signal peptide peptidase SppA [Pseudomonadota bacterium]
MTATADQIIERRKTRRSLTLWRILAIVALVIAVIVLLPRPGFGPAGSHIARIAVDGVILDEPKRERLILDLADDSAVKAVIVRVNSPGGTVTASESLYLALRRVAEVKPVVAVMSEYAASGGYITAIAGDYVVARGNTLTGSIGVVAEVPNVSGLMEMLGVGVTRIKSAPLKAEPNVTEPPSPEALRAQEALILDMFDWFQGLVADRRGLANASLAAVTDGRAFTGRQALQLGLVDALGDEGTAVAWLEETREIDSGLPILDHDWRDPDVPWPLQQLGDAAAGLTGAERFFSPVPRLYAIIQ